MFISSRLLLWFVTLRPPYLWRHILSLSPTPIFKGTRPSSLSPCLLQRQLNHKNNFLTQSVLCPWSISQLSEYKRNRAIESKARCLGWNFFNYTHNNNNKKKEDHSVIAEANIKLDLEVKQTLLVHFLKFRGLYFVPIPIAPHPCPHSAVEQKSGALILVDSMLSTIATGQELFLCLPLLPRLPCSRILLRDSECPRTPPVPAKQQTRSSPLFPQ